MWFKKDESLLKKESKQADYRLYLQFIEEVITRMNSNSFSMKGWMVAIVSAFVAIYASNNNKWLLIAPIIPTLLLWFLDSYYLQMERKYRKLYKDAVNGRKELYDMNISEYKECLMDALFSKSVGPFYIIIIAFLTALTIFIYYDK